MAGLSDMPHRSVMVAVCLAGLALVVGGCGRPLPEVVPVRGVVTVDGKPVVLMDVVFQPLPGTPGAGAVGRTGSDGRFEMVAIVGGATRVLPGARPGRYRVVFAEPELYTPDGMPQRRPAEAGAITVPHKYMDANASPPEVEVIAGMPDVVLDLQSK